MHTRDLKALLQLLSISGQSGILSLEPRNQGGGQQEWTAQLLLSEGVVAACRLRFRTGHVVSSRGEVIPWLSEKGELTWSLEVVEHEPYETPLVAPEWNWVSPEPVIVEPPPPLTFPFPGTQPPKPPSPTPSTPFPVFPSVPPLPKSLDDISFQATEYMASVLKERDERWPEGDFSLWSIPRRVPRSSIESLRRVLRSREYRNLFALVDSNRNIKDIAATLRIPPGRTARLLQELQNIGVIEI